VKAASRVRGQSCTETFCTGHLAVVKGEVAFSVELFSMLGQGLEKDVP